MSDDFGDEFWNLTEKVAVSGRDVGTVQFVASVALDIGPQFDDFVRDAGSTESARQSGMILYIPPGVFRLSRRADGTPYELPPNTQLFICQGAFLRPDADVQLIIRGSLRAGPYQIFGYAPGTLTAPAYPGHRTAPLGRVILATDLIPEVLPEWWGARALALHELGSPGSDSWDGIQRAINAACVDRDEGGVRRPPIPVRLSGMYRCNQSLVVTAPSPGDPRCLVLRGSMGLGGRDSGRFSIFRAAGAPTDPTVPDCALYLGPGVDFDIEDVHLHSTEPVGASPRGCLDIACDAKEGTRRGLLRRCTLVGGTEYTMRIAGSVDGVRRQFFVDACRIQGQNHRHLADCSVQIDAGPLTMVHIDGALMGTASALALDSPRPENLPPGPTLRLSGASVLVKATQFHHGSGPRPSRWDPALSVQENLAQPDGQDVFLETVPSPRVPTQFTAMNCESQSWWFLSRPGGGDHQVVLINVVHANVNWEDDPRGQNRLRFDALAGGASRPIPSPRPAPPSVVWLGSGGRCVLVGCRLHASLLIEAAFQESLVDVATVFYDLVDNIPPPDPPDPRDPPDPSVRRTFERQHFRPSTDVRSVPRPPDYRMEYLPGGGLDFEILHPVPVLRDP